MPSPNTTQDVANALSDLRSEMRSEGVNDRLFEDCVAHALRYILRADWAAAAVWTEKALNRSKEIAHGA